MKYIRTFQYHSEYEAVKSSLPIPNMALCRDENYVHFKSGAPIRVVSVQLNKTASSLDVGGSETLVATVLPSDAADKSVIWSSSDASVVTVNNNGLVTAVSGGKANIIVKTNDRNITALCELTSIAPTVSVTGVTLNKNTLSLNGGESETLVATVLPSNATNKSVTWSSSNSSVASVNDGLVTAVGAGNAVITVITVDGGYTASCVVTSVVPTVPVTGVTLNKSSISFDVGDTETLVATVSPSDATNKSVTWSSNNSNVVTVDSNGNITAVGAGDATVTVTTVDGGYIAMCDVYVHSIYVPVEGVSLDKHSISLTVGGIEYLEAIVSPSNASNKSVTWLSYDDDGVVMVDDDGLVTAVREGSTVIVVKTNDGGYTDACSVSVSSVVVHVTGVDLNKSSLSLSVGDTETLVATVSPTNASNKTVVWHSSDTDVVTVDYYDGYVTAVGAGSAIITVTTVDGGYQDTCSVSVASAVVHVTGVDLNKSSLSLSVGDTETLVATVSPSDATNKSVTWSSNNNSVATVDSNGNITAVGAGDATVTVTTDDGGYTEGCVVGVSNPSSHEYIEVHGTKWATMNIGATAVTDTGLYFAWKDPNGYTADQIGCSDGKKCFSHDWGDFNGGIDDSVSETWGSDWRMPTDAEFIDLIADTTSAWTSSYNGSGVPGVILTLKNDPSKELFFPAAGTAENGSINGVGHDGQYWSSSPTTYDDVTAFFFTFDKQGHISALEFYYMYIGILVRGVYIG